MMARIKYRIPQGFEESLENTKEKKNKSSTVDPKYGR